jgi:hypothetical protein
VATASRRSIVKTGDSNVAFCAIPATLILLETRF